jgi:Citrate synthase
METQTKKFSPGLEGVIAYETVLGHVFGEEGRLVYRGFDAVDLAEKECIESVWWLFREGKLPNAAQLAAFKKEVESAGTLSDDEIALVKTLRGGQPLSAVRTAISAIANKRDYKPWLNRELKDVDAEIMALCAITPAVIEILHSGNSPIAKPDNSGYAERYVWGILGGKPTADQLSATETYLILTMDHGSNASTFSGRVTASTGADVGGALTAAIATLSGPLHGGAPGPVLDMLDAIGTKENAKTWVDDQMAKGRKIMGFGHRVYRTEDPRARCLRGVAERLHSPRTELARTVEQTILAALEEKQKAKAQRLNTPVRTLRVNVEFWTAVVLDHVGIPRSLFSSTFCASRIIGWGEQIREQTRDNKLFRPLSLFIEPVVEPVTAESAIDAGGEAKAVDAGANATDSASHPAQPAETPVTAGAVETAGAKEIAANAARTPAAASTMETVVGKLLELQGAPPILSAVADAVTDANADTDAQAPVEPAASTDGGGKEDAGQ